MRRYLLLFALLATALPAVATEEEAMDDTRLEQQVTITEPGDRLGTVLERLSKKTGVTLYAHVPMRDTTVVVRYEGALKGLMDALTHFFAVDKENKAKWIDEGGDRYTLSRSHTGERAAQQLIKERQVVAERAMDQAIRDGNPWVKGLGLLTDKQRLAIYAGTELTVHADELGGRPFLDDLLGSNASTWGDDAQVTFAMRGRSPHARLFLWRVQEGIEGRVGQEVEEGVGVWTICPELAPGPQQAQWRERYGDPAPVSSPVAKYSLAVKGEIPRREALLQIAEIARVNLIADDHGQVVNSQQVFPPMKTLSTLLDAACSFALGPPGKPEAAHGSFWRKVGDVYIVRSLAWPEEELATQSAPRAPGAGDGS